MHHVAKSQSLVNTVETCSQSTSQTTQHQHHSVSSND